MIRPRVGDFLYSRDELGIMLEDIRIIKQLDVRGFVLGVLNREGRVDVECMKAWVILTFYHFRKRLTAFSVSWMRFCPKKVSHLCPFFWGGLRDFSLLPQGI